MQGVRSAAVAGQFYPDNAGQLRGLVGRYLQAARPGGPVPKALIVPHAGYAYSGPIAASAYALLALLRARVRRVVLLGPAHFATPLGQVPVDIETVEAACRVEAVQVVDPAHTWEHCLEVQLPFLQEVLDDFAILPLLVGEAEAEEIVAVLDVLWGGDETLVVVSSDTSHFHDYETAQRLDGATAKAIEALKDENLDKTRACGCTAIKGLLRVARHRRLQAEVVDLRNSGDTAGPPERVVGYGAYAFFYEK